MASPNFVPSTVLVSILVFTGVFLCSLCSLASRAEAQDCGDYSFTLLCKDTYYFPYSTYLGTNCSNEDGKYIPSGVFLKYGIVYNSTLKSVECGKPYPYSSGGKLDKTCKTSFEGTILSAQCYDFEVTSSSVGYQIYNSTIDVSDCLGVSNCTHIYFCG